MQEWPRIGFRALAARERNLLELSALLDIICARSSEDYYVFEGTLNDPSVPHVSYSMEDIARARENMMEIARLAKVAD